MIASRHGSIDAGMAFRGARWALHVGRRRFFLWLKKSLKNTLKQLQQLNNFRGAYILLPVVPVPPAWSMVRDPEPNNRNRHQKQKLRQKSLNFFFLPEFCLALHSAFENVNSESFTLTLTGLDLQIDFYLILILSWNQKDANFLVHILFLRMAVAHWFQHSFWTRDGAPQSKTGWYLYVWVDKSSSLQQAFSGLSICLWMFHSRHLTWTWHKNRE